MKTLFLFWLAIFALIFLVDWYLGPIAEHLNAYELVRRSLIPVLPHSSDRFLVGQDTLGQWALVVGWLAWGLEAFVVEVFLFWLGSFLV